MSATSSPPIPRERRRGPGTLDQVTETWGSRYGAIVRLWENAWEQFIPFLDYDMEIRTVLCSTITTESLNAPCRRAIKCLYLVTRSLVPTGTGRDKVGHAVEAALNAFVVTFGDRFPAAGT